MKTTSRQLFQRWAFFLLFYTLLVIIWGAWVRISHSGDGCGESWPLCQGQVIPTAATGKTWVELSHRLTSGLFGIFVLGLFLCSRKIFPSSHPARKVSRFALFFTVTEALLGANLVLMGLVAENDSPMRALVMTLHLMNSLLLMGSITLLWDFAGAENWRRAELHGQQFRLSQRLVIGFLLAFLILGATGSVAALSTTLYPSQSLLTGVLHDFAPDSHYLLKLRGLHPISGIILGGLMALTAYLVVQLLSPQESILVHRGQRLAAALFVGIVVGVLTLLTLSPVPLKLVHLAMTHTIWIFFVLWLRAWRFIG